MIKECLAVAYSRDEYLYMNWYLSQVLIVWVGAGWFWELVLVVAVVMF